MQSFISSERLNVSRADVNMKLNKLSLKKRACAEKRGGFNGY